MNSVKYNNNPDAKNYSNCDISGSFYTVGPVTATASAVAVAVAEAVKDQKDLKVLDQKDLDHKATKPRKSS